MYVRACVRKYVCAYVWPHLNRVLGGVHKRDLAPHQQKSFVCGCWRAFECRKMKERETNSAKKWQIRVANFWLSSQPPDPDTVFLLFSSSSQSTHRRKKSCTCSQNTDLITRMELIGFVFLYGCFSGIYFLSCFLHTLCSIHSIFSLPFCTLLRKNRMVLHRWSDAPPICTNVKLSCYKVFCFFFRANDKIFKLEKKVFRRFHTSRWRLLSLPWFFVQRYWNHHHYSKIVNQEINNCFTKCFNFWDTNDLEQKFLHSLQRKAHPAYANSFWYKKILKVNLIRAF